MSYRDVIVNALGNLWRMKLRSTLTVSGIVIAIAAFVTMLSFGIGMQRNVSEQFETLGLLSTMYVYPPRAERVTDSAKTDAVLNEDATRRFAAIPGVNLAYPLDEFSVTVVFGDSTVKTEARALPQAAASTRLFSKLNAGTAFTGDSSRQVLVSTRFLDLAGVKPVDAAIGMPLVISSEVTSIDSALAYAVDGLGALIWRRVSGVWRDSLVSSDTLVDLAHDAATSAMSRFQDGLRRSQRIDSALIYTADGLSELVRSRLPRAWRDSIGVREFAIDIARDVASRGMTQFIDGLLNARRTVTDTLTVCGVIESHGGGGPRFPSVIIPAATASRLNSGDISDDPTTMMASLRSGELLGRAELTGGREYPRVTLDLDPNVAYEPIRDSIKALGYRTFSFVEEFNEMRKFFRYFNLGLSMVGIIALITASLGIVNTMVMSILERQREIGVLKSLGADDSDIRRMFLIESGLIGTIGASVGIVFGWIITRVATAIAHSFMAKEGVPLFELFSFPLWLIAGAISFGLLVSLGAGLYPASRAARVDPVQALRQD